MEGYKMKKSQLAMLTSMAISLAAHAAWREEEEVEYEEEEEIVETTAYSEISEVTTYIQNIGDEEGVEPTVSYDEAENSFYSEEYETMVPTTMITTTTAEWKNFCPNKLQV